MIDMTDEVVGFLRQVREALTRARLTPAFTEFDHKRDIIRVICRDKGSEVGFAVTAREVASTEQRRLGTLIAERLAQAIRLKEAAHGG